MTAFQSLFDWKVRGIRVVEIIGVACVAAMVFSVYLAKAAAAREGSRISEIERQIATDRQRVRLLRAEVARLEQPQRLGALSRAAGLAPVAAQQQVSAAGLDALAPRPEPEPEPVAAPPPAAAPDAATPDEAAAPVVEAATGEAPQ